MSRYLIKSPYNDRYVRRWATCLVPLEDAEKFTRYMADKIIQHIKQTIGLKFIRKAAKNEP